MSQLLNTFELNLTSATEILKTSFDTNLLTETSATPYTATFTDVDNIDVDSQALYQTTIGSLKIVWGLMLVTGTQDNQALGKHRVSLPSGFFTTYYSSIITLGQSTAYQLTAHTIDQTDFESIYISYSQGQTPGSSNNPFTVNLLIIGS
jgi:hypothetical protein